jgi:ketosteroid isomerase-like protein
MSVKENKEAVHRIYRLLNEGKGTTIYDNCTPDFIEHLPAGDMTRDTVISYEEQFASDFQDLRVSIKDMVAEGERVAVLVTWQGRHKATGKPITMTNANFFRFKKGQWAESWNVTDIRLAQQLGENPSK